MSIIELSTASSEGHSDTARAAYLPDRGERPTSGAVAGAAYAQSLSGVSWGAVLAGAAVAAAFSLVLLALGTGLGLAAISPWPQRGVQASTFGVASIVWVIVTQLCASALGGYLAGRLRVRWLQVPADEVYFRDTAHGLLTWAVATLATAALLLSTAAGALGHVSQAAATLAAGTAAGGVGVVATAGTGPAMDGQGNGSAVPAPSDASGPMGYAVDYLLRRDPAAPAEAGGTDAGAAPVGEVRRIFANALDAASLPVQDVHYLGQVVARRTGLPLTDAEARATQAFGALQTRIANAKLAAAVAAESARKVALQAALWLFIALLAGAFVASCTALMGGRERDA